MQRALLALALSGLGRDALKLACSLTLAVVIAMGFTVSSLGVLLGAGAPAPGAASSGLNAMAGDRALMVRYPEGAAGEAPTEVVALARTQIGRPYVWGGASPGTSFDCSGLVQWVYGQLGVRLVRTAQQQFNATQRIAPDQLAPGDLVFFQICCQPPDRITHVAIYVGDGRVIHAPTPGQLVREESIDTPFWRQHYAGAGRVVG